MGVGNGPAPVFNSEDSAIGLLGKGGNEEPGAQRYVGSGGNSSPLLNLGSDEAFQDAVLGGLLTALQGFDE